MTNRYLQFLLRYSESIEMGFKNWFIKNVGLALVLLLFLVVFKIVYSLWIWPNMVYKKLRRNGLYGPSPSFPLGNINDMVASKKKRDSACISSLNSNTISHDIHSKVLPYFTEWQNSYGKYICMCVF